MTDLKVVLRDNQIHIWQISLIQPEYQIQSFSKLLSKGEADRAARFRFEHHRRRYVVSHGALRLILTRYLGIPPSKIKFEASAQGKPHLIGESAYAELKFNLAHSHELAIVAITRGYEIGVDIEYIRPNPDMDGIATRFFSPSEYAAYAELPQEHKTIGFFNCWTRKEAFIKALGEGLSHPLDQFDVTLKPQTPAQLLRVGNDPHEASLWTLESFTPNRDYVGAFAIRTRNNSFQYYQFDSENRSK